MASLVTRMAKLGKDAIAAADSEDRRRLMPTVRDSDVDHTDDDDGHDDHGSNGGDRGLYYGSGSDYALNMGAMPVASLASREMDILEVAEEDLETKDMLAEPHELMYFYEEEVGDIGVPRLTVKRQELIVQGVCAPGQTVVYAPLGISEVREIALKKVKLRPRLLTRPWHAVHVSLVKVIQAPVDPTKDTAAAGPRESSTTKTEYFELGEKTLVRRETNAGDSGRFDACQAIGPHPFDCPVPALVNMLSGSMDLNANVVCTADGTGKQSWTRNLLTFTILAEYAYAYPAECDAIEEVLLKHGHMCYFLPADLATRVRWHSFHKYSLARADAWYVKFERADDRPFVAGEDDAWSVELQLEAIYNVAN